MEWLEAFFTSLDAVVFVFLSCFWFYFIFFFSLRKSLHAEMLDSFVKMDLSSL